MKGKLSRRASLSPQLLPAQGVVGQLASSLFPSVYSFFLDQRELSEHLLQEPTSPSRYDISIPSRGCLTFLLVQVYSLCSLKASTSFPYSPIVPQLCVCGRMFAVHFIAIKYDAKEKRHRNIIPVMIV